MSFMDGENSDLTSENMEQEEKINIEETSINLGYVKKEFDNEEPEFEETQYKIASNFENISQESSEQRNSGDSFKEENKDLKQETIEQSVCIELEIIQCHCCKVLFEEWEHLENHMLHCPDEKYNRLYDNKLDIQRKSADEVEETEGNGEISIAIDDNRSCLTLTETIDSKCADGISQTCKEGSSNEKKHKCSECSYQTDNKTHLRTHLNAHYNIRPFECDICKIRFTYKANLKVHILSKHSNIKAFECDICKKRFTRKDTLNMHIQDKHLNINEKKYKCTGCPYQTNDKGNLKKHLNIHNNIRAFECDVCKKAFNRKYHLKMHIRDQHSNTNEKKYKCTECSYETDYKTRLKVHLNVHYNIKAFECDICKKRFSTKNSLKVHIENQH